MKIRHGLMAALVASQVPAQNLLTNGTFDNDLSGWWNNDGRGTWLGDTGNTLAGGSGPGAAEVSADGSVCNGGTLLMTQTVPVTAGKEMRGQVAAYVPGAGNSATGAGAFVDWESDSGDIIATSWFHGSDSLRDEWFWLEVVATVPEGASRAEFGFGVRMPGGGCTQPAGAIFDDAFLGEVASDLFVPAAAATPGSNGTYWSTTLWAANPNPAPVDLLASFLPAGQDNSSVWSGFVELGVVPAGGTLEISDVVSQMGASGTGGLFLRAEDHATGGAPSEGLQVVTYTFTPNPGGGGNYGQGIPGEVPGAGELVRAVGVRHDDAYRTNVGALNTSDEPITLEVSIVDADGTVIGSRTWNLAPYGQWQESVGALGVSSLGQGVAVFRRVAGHGAFLAYLSRVDNASGDAVYVAAR